MCKLTITAVVVILVALLAACSGGPTDATIAQDIQNRIATDPDTRDAQINIVTHQYKVTLTGTVKNVVTQRKLEQIARAEPGVVEVDDETVIAEVAPVSRAAVQRLQPVPSLSAPRQKLQPMIVPSGTVLTVRTGQALSSKSSHAGQTFLATLVQPISIGGRPALPVGAVVSGTVVSAKPRGKISGAGQLSLTVTSISVERHTYQIQSNVLSSTEKGKGRRSAAMTGGGAGGGALIGGLAGGGKGAGIGALVGAGAGFVGGAVTGNKQIEIPAESALSFTLSAPLELPPSAE